MSKRNHKTPNLQKSPIKTSQSLVTVVIPVLNRFDILEKCLASIPGAFGEYSYNVVIVDNGSNKEIADKFYSNLSDPITIIRGRENAGFPVACNYGAKRTRSQFLFFLNSDVVLEEGSIKYLIEKFDDPKTGVVGMKLVFPTDLLDLDPRIRPAGKLQHVGLSVDIHSEIYHAFIGWDEFHPRVMKQDEVFAVTGAAMMVHRDLWNKLGGFYEGYGMGTFEDVDLCQTARELGYNIRVVPLARGWHYTGASAEANKVQYPLRQNRLTFMQRHAKNLIWWDGIIL